MKKKILAVLCGILVLIGCLAGVGIQNYMSQDTQKSSTANKEIIIPETANLALPVKGNIEELHKNFPNWFNEEGAISYPVTPGSKEWEEAETHQEMRELVQIPKEIVDAIDTEKLLKAVEAYPLFDFNLYDDFEQGLKEMSKGFYGMEVLLRRADAYKAAASSYLNRKVVVYGDQVKDQKQMNEIRLEEYLISKRYAYEGMTEEERETIWEAIQKNQEVEEQLRSLGAVYEYGFYEMIQTKNNPWKK